MSDKSENIVAGFLGISILGYLILAAAVIFFGITGIYLAFAASIILGICLFFVPPMWTIIGLAYWVFGKDIPAAIVNWLTS